ncbi:TRAF family member-associated NF-kappa-B activator-like [Rhinophrynus dorsalis]
MEEAFLSLYQEFQVLQTICTKQAELLQKLLARKGLSSEMPFSKPIQCTDSGDPACSECPFFRLHEKEEPSVESSNTMKDTSPHSLPLTTKEKQNVLLDFDVIFPPNTDKYSFLASDAEKVDFAVGHAQLDLSLEKKENTDLETFIKNYTPQFPNGINSEEKRAIHPTIAGLDFLIPVREDEDLSLSNLYEEDLCYLQSSDISFGVCLAAEKKHPFGVRGPTQSSWSPGCLSEECQLGSEVIMNSDTGLSSQICEFCQAVFPAGVATKGEYLRHLTGHVE